MQSSCRFRTSINPTRPLRRLSTKTMPCYVAAAPSCAPRQRAAYHHGLGPWAVRGGGNPFAELTSSLQPLFKLLDEELTGAAQQQQAPARPRSFQPRFDVREEAHAFHLAGELPGIDQKDIAIEFKDEHTLVVRGRTVRESRSADQPAEQAAATEASPTETMVDADAASDAGSNYHKPTVEDEFVDVGAESEKPAATAAPSAEDKGKQVEKPAATEASKDKYWVSERSVGQFHRSFTFPGHIDQEAVTANLKNGILNITVPKAQQKEPRRIAIE